MSNHLVGVAEICDIMGVSRQRVAQIIETYDDFPQPEVEIAAGRVWSRAAGQTWAAVHHERGPGRPVSLGPDMSRFTDRARRSIEEAARGAEQLGHNYIGTEHILLGLRRVEDGVAAKVLEEAKVSDDVIAQQIVSIIGKGESPPAERRPFTPRALNVLTNGLSEALKLGHNYVGTEHLLLSVIRDPEGVAFKILTEAGVTQDRLRKRVVEVLAGYRAKGSGDADVKKKLDDLARQVEELRSQLGPQ